MKLLSYLFLLVGSTAVAQTDLELFLSHPIESEFAASADGKNIAWVINDHGKRNIMIKAGTELPRLLTDYQLDDGQELKQLTFSPNGTKLLYVRGSEANKAGQNPNPASLPGGTDMAIWYKEISSKSPATKLTAGSNPVFYKDGLKFLFSRGGQIFESTMDINAVPKQLFFIRGNNADPKFSPDGREILFTSDRGNHSFIGIYHTDKKTIRWLALDVTHDNFGVWSPDGKQVAFIRTPGTKIGSLNDITGGTRFSIVIADTETGKGVEIWKSPSDDGGFAQGAPDPLVWTSANRILFYSEHTGMNHVFSMNPNGSDLKDITPSEGEVESFVTDPTGQFIYFDGNRNDTNRRHIWKTNVLSGNPVAVTSGEGIEMYPALAGKDLYGFKSTFNTARSLVKIDESKNVSTPVYPQKLPSFSPASFVKPEAVMVKAADGMMVHGQLFIDRKIAGKRPGIVFIHGGPHRQMLLGMHYMEYYSYCYSFNQLLASKGYAVIAVNYRNGIGYGKDFRRAKNQGPRGASEYQDIVAAGKYLQTLPEVEASKIGLWGGSYGGYMTAMGLARNPELFKAGADVHGVHDWSFDGQDATNFWGLKKSEAELALKSSPAFDLSKWVAPVFVAHGDDDRNVNFQQTVDIVEKLREKNVDVELLVLPDEVHGFLRYESWSSIFNAARDFFDRKLKK